MEAKEMREERLKRGVTQAQLAFTLGVTLASVHRWETGKAKPNLLNEYIFKLWLVMGYNPKRKD